MGKKLSEKGIDIEHNFDKEEGLFISILIMVTLLILGAVLIGKYNLQKVIFANIPTIILIYLQAYFYPFMFIISHLIFGIILGLELQKLNVNRVFILIIILTIPISILWHYSLPVTNLVGEEKTLDGIVLQTTDYTCGPTSIANLGRLSGIAPNLSEKEVVKLTKTTRFGTTTLAQIQTLKQLKLNPNYQRNLKINDLIEINKLAILHVKEPIQNRKIAHAVVLLKINKEEELITIANPLYGIENKPFSDFNDYWIGEAIFVEKSLFEVI